MFKEEVMRSFDELAQSRKAPKIDLIDLVVVPTRFVTPSELQEGMTALQLAAENLRRKKAARAELEAAQAQAEIVLWQSTWSFAEWMKDLGLRHIADIYTFVEELGEEYLDEEYVGVREQEEAVEGEEKKTFTVGERRNEVREMIDKYLNCGDPRVSLPLEATEVAFWLSIKPFSKQELIAKMRRFVSDNVLVVDKRGDIEVLRENYFLHKRFDALKEPHRTEVKTKIRDAIMVQANRIKNEEQQTRLAKVSQAKAKVAQFIKDSDLPILEVLDETKTGQCGALVSDGGIWFRVNTDDIEILDVVGAPENGFANLVAIEEAYQGQKVRVSRKALKGKDGELAKPDESPRIQVPVEISKDKDNANRWINANKFAWHAVRGAIEFAMECQRRVIYGLTHDEFHRERELGKYKPNMAGFVYNIFGPDKEVKHETALTDSQLEVERFETEEGDVKIRVTGYNPEFAEFFESHKCLLPQGFFEGERFVGCPALIKLVLQRDFGIKTRSPKGTNGRENGYATKPTEDTRVANVYADLTRVQ